MTIEEIIKNYKHNPFAIRWAIKNLLRKNNL